LAFDDMRVVKCDRSGPFQRTRYGKYRPPFARKNGVNHIDHTIYGKQPHEKEMKLQALGQAVRNTKEIVKPLRKKVKKLVAKNTYGVGRICQVDEHAAPHHHREQRKIDPVQPADRERMFFLKLFRRHYLKTPRAEKLCSNSFRM